MYLNPIMQESIKKVEAAREANMRMDPRRMTAEEKDILLKTYHPDYRDDQFTELKMGPNKGGKVPVELAELLQGKARITSCQVDLEKPAYDVDVLIIGGGGSQLYQDIGKHENR